MSYILIAGIGNVFLGDDGFGVEVARRLHARQASHALPDGVRVEDFGIRGIDLCYALLDGVDAAILVDAVQRGGPPGSLYVIEPEPADPGSMVIDTPPMLMSPHEMDPARMLQAVRMLGGDCRNVVLVGCEPASLGTEGDGEGRMGLSEAVTAALEPAIDLIESMVAQKIEQLRAGSAI